MKNINKIDIQFIDHAQQRYETCGDYWIEGDTLHIRVSVMKDYRFQWLVMVHEIFELFLVTEKGVPIEDIDAFDKKFEEIRSKYPDIIGDQEPGNMVSAPYNLEHLFATYMEKLFSNQIGVDWNDYDEAVNALGKPEAVPNPDAKPFEPANL